VPNTAKEEQRGVELSCVTLYVTLKKDYLKVQEQLETKQIKTPEGSKLTTRRV